MTTRDQLISMCEQLIHEVTCPEHYKDRDTEQHDSNVEAVATFALAQLREVQCECPHPTINNCLELPTCREVKAIGDRAKELSTDVGEGQDIEAQIKSLLSCMRYDVREAAEKDLRALIEQVKTTPPPAAGFELDGQLRKFAEFILRGDSPRDHACVECVPHSDMLINGFKCVYHEAAQLIAAAPKAGGK